MFVTIYYLHLLLEYNFYEAKKKQKYKLCIQTRQKNHTVTVNYMHNWQNII